VRAALYQFPQLRDLHSSVVPSGPQTLPGTGDTDAFLFPLPDLPAHRFDPIHAAGTKQWSLIGSNLHSTFPFGYPFAIRGNAYDRMTRISR
jgi:hypothetical protein